MVAMVTTRLAFGLFGGAASSFFKVKVLGWSAGEVVGGVGLEGWVVGFSGGEELASFAKGLTPEEGMIGV